MSSNKKLIKRCARGVVDMEQRKAQMDHNSGSRGNSSKNNKRREA